MLPKISTKPVNLNIATAAEREDHEIDDFYGEIKELLKFTENHEVNIIMGVVKAKIGTNHLKI